MPMFNIHKRIFIYTSIVAGIGVVILLLYLFVFRGEDIDGSQVKNTPVTTISGVIEPGGVMLETAVVDTTISKPIPPKSVKEKEELYVRQLAASFVEKFGSYSNQNNNSHITGVLPLLTDSMGEWVQTQAMEQSNEYVGATTRVIVGRLETLENDRAIVRVEAQETHETQRSMERKYRTGTVRLLRVAGVWKINGLYWE